MNDAPEPTPPSPALAFNLDDLRLLPDWMKADAPAPPGAARREERRFEDHDGRDRGDRRDDRRPPRPGGGGFRGGSAEARGPRPGGAGGGGGFREGRRDDRGPRPGGSGGGQRDRRDDRRGSPPPRRFEERPAPTRPAPVRVEFLPDPRPLAGIAKEIRARHLAYPLFGLARMFLERPESHRIRLSVEALPSAKEGEKPGEPRLLFQLGEDGPVALSRGALENLAFDRYRDRYYVEQSVQKDPPKGNFTAVARERGSGVLLGPPNHHSYQPNLRALYENRYSRRMDFEEFRRGVEIINDPALVERWKEEVRTVTTYSVRDTLPADVLARLDAPKNNGEANPVVPETAEGTPEPASADSAVEPEATAPASPEEEAAVAPASEPAAEAAAEPITPVEDAGTPPATVAAPVVFENLADVRAHFRQHYLDGLIRSGSRLELPGPAGRQLPEAALTLSLRLAHETELRYPAGLVQPLRVGLQSAGLHIFKHRKRVVYVSAIRPTIFRSGGESGGAVSEGIAAILETVAAQPMISGKDLAVRVIARRLGPEIPAPETPIEPPAPTLVEAPTAEPTTQAVAVDDVEPTAPAAIPAPTNPRQEAADRFKAHLAADLRYLIGAGHVIAFHNGTFDLPLPPRPKDPPKPAAVPSAASKGTASTAPAVPGATEDALDEHSTVTATADGSENEEETVVEADATAVATLETDAAEAQSPDLTATPGDEGEPPQSAATLVEPAVRSDPA